MKVLTIVLLSVGASTTVGVLAGFLVRALPHRWNDVILGFSAGVMLAAAAVGLIAPAFASTGAVTLPVAGVLSGAAVISLLDRAVQHLHRLAGMEYEEHSANGSISKSLLFVAALALHKLPEGLAAGVSFGTGNLGDVMTVAGAISLQNVPEAFVIVSPLFAVGVRPARVLAISLGIALFSMASVLCGYALVSVFVGALPFFLASAGGAMLYVVSDEMIPETHSHGYEKSATFSLIAGFLLVLILQVKL